MGVIYKFKKEVIDFVLRQKRESPGLSCRQLAVLTSEKFKLQVSKSSVNAIIKNAHLSSGVGRRPGFEPAPRKFQIPLRRKKQLSDEMRKVGLEKKKQPVAPVPAPIRRVPAAASSASRPPQIIPQDFWGQVEHLRQERNRRRGPVQEGMGCVFLMAALWELSRTSVFGKLLRKYTRQQISDFFDAACDILPCLSVLGVNNADQIGQFSGHALWTFFPPAVLAGDILGIFRDLEHALYPGKLLLEYEEEKKQLSVQASEFHVFLEDGSEVTMDARLTGVWPQKVLPWFSAPVEQAMAALSHCVVSNNQPAIFLSSAGRLSPDGREAPLGRDLRPSADRLPAGGGKEQFHQGVWEMIAAWEGLANKRLKKLDVLSPSGEPLATFSSFPDKKRIFMLGVWPWQKEFTSLLKDIKEAGEPEPFYCEELDQVVYIRGWLTNIFQGQLKGVGPLRAIAVSISSPTATEAVILTNGVKGTAKDFVRAFLRRWPYLDQGPVGRALIHPTDRETRSGGPRDDAFTSPGPGSLPFQREQAGLFVLSKDLGNVLHRYCQKRFWNGLSDQDDISSIDKTCYKISGCCSSGSGWLTVFLKPPAGYERLSELRLAAQRLNESAVTDPRGRQLFVVVE